MENEMYDRVAVEAVEGGNLSIDRENEKQQFIII